jgi:hypothetical protein
MTTSTLIEVVANLDSYDPECTIYAVRPWTGGSEAIVAREPDDGGLPHEAKSHSATYLIEVGLAQEFLGDWMAAERRKPSPSEQCARLIDYAVNDA